MRLLSTSEAARRLGISPASVKRWADQGRLTAIRTPGGHRRFASEEGERFREARETSGDLASGWANRLLSVHGPAGLRGALLEERSRRGAWWSVAAQLGPVDVELARRVTAGEISPVDRLVAGEHLQRAVEQSTGDALVCPGAPSLLLARPEFDPARLGLALVELCAGELGWATLLAGAVPAADLRRHLERRPPTAVVLASSRACDPSQVAPYASAIRADCGRCSARKW